MPVALYLRISLDRADQQIGVARQRKDCRAIAGIRWPNSPVIEIADNDVSAYTTKPRPGYLELLALIKSGAVSGVVAYNLDRLLRQPRELETLIDLGVPIVTAQGDLDLTTHDGQLQARILVAVAKKSSDDSSRRIKRAHQDRAERGVWHGGRHVPFGYARGAYAGELIVDPRAADIVQQVAKMVVAGNTLVAAVRDITGECRGGGQHHVTSGATIIDAPHTREAWRLILTGPIARGFNSSWQPATWPTILDVDLGAGLSAALAKRSRTRPNKRWPLSAVARCGKCQGKLYGTVNHSYSAYACRTVGCHGVCVDSGHLESDVRIALDEAVIVVPGRKGELLESVAQGRLEHLAEEYALGNITRAEWEAARRMVPSREVASVDAPRRTAGIDLPLSRCHEIIDHILVRPIGKGGSYSPDRISIVWRH